MNFVVEVPIHEVAANTLEDVIASLEYVAKKLRALPRGEGFPEFTLDEGTINDLSYLSYGVKHGSSTETS